MSAPGSVFECAFGPDPARLPPVIGAAHTSLPSLPRGRVEVETGPHPPARLFGFPAADGSGASRFDIGITMPGLGLVVRSRGALADRTGDRPDPRVAAGGFSA